MKASFFAYVFIFLSSFADAGFKHVWTQESPPKTLRSFISSGAANLALKHMGWQDRLPEQGPAGNVLESFYEDFYGSSGMDEGYIPHFGSVSPLNQALGFLFYPLLNPPRGDRSDKTPIADLVYALGGPYPEQILLFFDVWPLYGHQRRLVDSLCNLEISSQDLITFLTMDAKLKLFQRLPLIIVESLSLISSWGESSVRDQWIDLFQVFFQELEKPPMKGAFEKVWEQLQTSAEKNGAWEERRRKLFDTIDSMVRFKASLPQVPWSVEFSDAFMEVWRSERLGEISEDIDQYQDLRLLLGYLGMDGLDKWLLKMRWEDVFWWLMASAPQVKACVSTNDVDQRSALIEDLLERSDELKIQGKWSAVWNPDWTCVPISWDIFVTGGGVSRLLELLPSIKAYVAKDDKAQKTWATFLVSVCPLDVEGDGLARDDGGKKESPSEPLTLGSWIDYTLRRVFSSVNKCISRTHKNDELDFIIKKKSSPRWIDLFFQTILAYLPERNILRSVYIFAEDNFADVSGEKERLMSYAIAFALEDGRQILRDEMNTQIAKISEYLREEDTEVRSVLARWETKKIEKMVACLSLFSTLYWPLIPRYYRYGDRVIFDFFSTVDYVSHHPFVTSSDDEVRKFLTPLGWRHETDCLDQAQSLVQSLQKENADSVRRVLEWLDDILSRYRNDLDFIVNGYLLPRLLAWCRTSEEVEAFQDAWISHPPQISTKGDIDVLQQVWNAIVPYPEQGPLERVTCEQITITSPKHFALLLEEVTYQTNHINHPARYPRPRLQSEQS